MIMIVAIPILEILTVERTYRYLFSIFCLVACVVTLLLRHSNHGSMIFTVWLIFMSALSMYRGDFGWITMIASGSLTSLFTLMWCIRYAEDTQPICRRHTFICIASVVCAATQIPPLLVVMYVDYALETTLIGVLLLLMECLAEEFDIQYEGDRFLTMHQTSSIEERRPFAHVYPTPY
eukprot:481857_1